MITHDLGVVAMCEKIAVMYAGHICERGTADDIFYQPGHEYTKGLINSIPKLNTAENERLVPIERHPCGPAECRPAVPFAPRCKNCMKICLTRCPRAPSSAIPIIPTAGCSRRTFETRGQRQNE